MNRQKQFVLVSIMENAFMGHWSFWASDEVTVARHLLLNAWNYQDVFWALRISLRDVERLSAEELLQAIRDSYPNQKVRAVLYLFPIGEPADCAKAELATLPETLMTNDPTA
jgi:hypothetical protein